MKIVSAHQPAFMPWIGLIHKVFLSDVFIFMDIAKFRKRAFMHRNRIEINSTPHFIGLKVNNQSDFKLCSEINISEHHQLDLIKMKEKILFSYQKSEYMNDLEDFLENGSNDNSKSLNEICLSQLSFLCKKLDINTKIIKESDIISIEDTKKIDASQRLLNHAEITNANIYVTGINSKDYLDESLFKKNNVNHLVQKFDYKNFLNYQNCIEPLSIVHQIAKIGYIKIKKNLENFQTTKKDIINK
jgi:hypothetical protein